MKKLIFICLIVCFYISGAIAQDYEFKENVSYVTANESDVYKQERCKLDVYYPKGAKGFKTVVWFHGGGLEGGNKHLPEELKNKGFAVVSVNYRLSPKANAPAYIDDAAEAVAWVFKNISNFGGDPAQVYVSGHSAGGYLTLMVGLDKSYLAKFGIDADKIKGLIPISGQTITHNAIRKEQGLSPEVPYIDKYAPVNRIRKNLPPLLIVLGDRNLEMTARYEENAYLATLLKSLGNDVTFYEEEGFDHGQVGGAGCILLVNWLRKK